MLNLVKRIITISIIPLLATSCMPEETYEEIVYQTQIIEVEVEKEVYVYVEVPVEVEVDTEEPTVEELRDIYYNGDFDGTDYYNYFEIFMWEANNYGIDLSHVEGNEVIIETRTHNNKNWVAWAKERDNDEKVHIGININLFFDQQRSNRGRLVTMFHEFGHDIFNLEHVHVDDCSNFHNLMNSCAKKDINPEILKELVHEFFSSIQ